MASTVVANGRIVCYKLCRPFTKRKTAMEPYQPRGTNFNDGGGGRVRQRFIFFTQKNHTFRICLPKKSLLFLAYPQKSLSSFFATPKNPSGFFFATQKNPGVFHRPKKITFGQNFRPKKITRTPPSLKYVSRAPGLTGMNFYFEPATPTLTTNMVVTVVQKARNWEHTCIGKANKIKATEPPLMVLLLFPNLAT